MVAQPTVPTTMSLLWRDFPFLILIVQVTTYSPIGQSPLGGYLKRLETNRTATPSTAPEGLRRHLGVCSNGWCTYNDAFLILFVS